jgi:hypothetical protein
MLVIGDECWEWPGSPVGNGYGSIRDAAGRNQQAHRVAYEIFVGPIPAGMEVDHLCRRRRCVRFDHLEAVPHRVNSARAAYTRPVCSRGHLLPEPDEKGNRICRPCKRLREAAYQRRLAGAPQS